MSWEQEIFWQYFCRFDAVIISAYFVAMTLSRVDTNQIMSWMSPLNIGIFIFSKILRTTSPCLFWTLADHNHFPHRWQLSLSAHEVHVTCPNHWLSWHHVYNHDKLAIALLHLTGIGSPNCFIRLWASVYPGYFQFLFQIIKVPLCR